MRQDKQPATPCAPFRLADEIGDFIQSGVSIILAVVAGDGRAIAGRALASRVMADGAIRVIYPAIGNTAITAAVEAGGPIAVTFSAPMSHRTIQLKAMSSRSEALGPDDRTSLGQQIDAFAAILRAIGYNAAFVQSFCDNRSESVLVLGFHPEMAFEQTPGPGAGREL